jgi:hypothetical protein
LFEIATSALIGAKMVKTVSARISVRFSGSLDTIGNQFFGNITVVGSGFFLLFTGNADWFVCVNGQNPLIARIELFVTPGAALRAGEIFFPLIHHC